MKPTAGQRNLAPAVERMRQAQREYRRSNAPSDRRAAEKREREVDAIIETLRAEIARENQPELTGGQE